METCHRNTKLPPLLLRKGAEGAAHHLTIGTILRHPDENGALHGSNARFPHMTSTAGAIMPLRRPVLRPPFVSNVLLLPRWTESNPIFAECNLVVQGILWLWLSPGYWRTSAMFHLTKPHM
ncbi:hypothetical protein J3458_000654 [Metarhizium acridum]|uniref:uncharacterized protein n=1 Tax=Metarhizium acridum TaxID=92637 RepID=UPI001C6D185B|nr:hypothetical protein J3458_000654 [Metarhizium acridum]